MLETHLTGLEPWSLKKNRARDESDLEPLAVVLVIKPECYEKKNNFENILTRTQEASDASRALLLSSLGTNTV